MIQYRSIGITANRVGPKRLNYGNRATLLDRQISVALGLKSEKLTIDHSKDFLALLIR